MKRASQRTSGGFSLVELLVVILLLAVLAAIAIPLYISTKRASAARTCKANIAAIAAAESAFIVRFGQYCTNPSLAYNAADPRTGGLVGASEGLAAPTECPLDGQPYRVSGGTPGQPLVISCVHCSPRNGGDGAHEAVHPSPAGTDAYSWTMAAPLQE